MVSCREWGEARQQQKRMEKRGKKATRYGKSREKLWGGHRGSRKIREALKGSIWGEVPRETKKKKRGGGRKKNS